MPSKHRPGTKATRRAARHPIAKHPKHPKRTKSTKSKRRSTLAMVDATPAAVPRSGPRGAGGTRWKPGDAPRERKPPKVLAPEVARRIELLREQGYDITSVAEYLTQIGTPRTRQHVSDVIHRKWRYWHTNDAAIDAFCAVTGTTRDVAWPDLPELVKARARKAATESVDTRSDTRTDTRMASGGDD